MANAKSLRSSNQSEDLESLMDEPVRHIRGAQALAEAVRSEPDDEFPMDHEGIDYSFGDMEIQDGTGGYVPVRDLSDHMPEESYDSPDSLLRGFREALLAWKGIDVPFDELARSEDLVDFDGPDRADAAG